MYGKGSVSSDAMNQHKNMAGAGSKTDFGVGKIPGREAKHPDLMMSHEAMDDSMRSPSVKGKGGMAMQGAPDHGQGMGAKDHFLRGGSV